MVISPTKQYKNILKSKQRNQEKKIQEVPLYSGPVKVLAIPPFWASSKKALLRANTKPPVELVVADLDKVDTMSENVNAEQGVSAH